MGKKIKATIVAVLGALALIVGLLADAPQAISNASTLLPAWLQHPDFWWTVGTLAVTGVFLWIVWRQPEEDDGYTSMADAAKKYGSKHAMKSVGLAQFAQALLEQILIMPRSRLNTDAVFRQLEIVLADQVESVLGSDARTRFLSKVRLAKRKSLNDPIVTCQVVVPYVTELAMEKYLDVMESVINAKAKEAGEGA